MPAAKPTRPDATLAALYKAVLAAPDDDLPRLVYADRLEELGGHARAEFIRLQCHVAATDPWDEGHADALVRSEVLYDRHHEAWGSADLKRDLMRSKGVTPGVFDPFVRGFPEVTWANIETFTAAHRKALKKYPIRELVLVGGHTVAANRVSEIIHAVGARSVGLRNAHARVLSALVGILPLPCVREIFINCAGSSFRLEDVEQLARCVTFPNVEAVHLSGSVDEERLLTFVSRLRWPSIRLLSLYGEFTPRVQAALADAGWLTRLDTLSLQHHPTGGVDLANQPAGELTPLFRSKQLTNLRALSLDSFPFPPPVEQAFATSSLGPLDHFAIDGWCDPPVNDYRGWLASPALAGVKSLALSGPDRAQVVADALGRNGELRRLKWGVRDMTADAWAKLANGPASQSLRRLAIERGGLTTDAVQVLLAGRPWPNLAEVVVKYATSDGRAVAKFIDHPHFARLTHLDLVGGTHAAHLWKALAKSKTVGRFHKLRLGFAITDAEVSAVLDNPEVCRIGRLVLPNRVKVSKKTQRRYEKVFGVRITRDW